jgi:hypothetical protein
VRPRAEIEGGHKVARFHLPHAPLQPASNHIE